MQLVYKLQAPTYKLRKLRLYLTGTLIWWAWTWVDYLLKAGADTHIKDKQD
jgi:hypothetical protein